MAKPTKATPSNVDDADLVIPNEVAPSGHGGTAPAPVPHPLTEEANVESRPGELSDPENHEEVVEPNTEEDDTRRVGLTGRSRR